MKKIIKPIALVLFAAFIIIQFFRPEKNIQATDGPSANDISTVYPVPKEVAAILQTSCYDCHSNNTHYPWYANLQPVAWWLEDHIKEGKKEINFSEFASYRIGRQYKKFEEINKQIEEGEMPLESYTLIHTETKLSAEQKAIIKNWVNSSRDSIKEHYPEDSLKRPKRPQIK
jgi:hypothetical protein